jgi:hypothetical protein
MGSRFQFHHQLVFLFPCREETRILQFLGGLQSGAATGTAVPEQLQLVCLDALERLELGEDSVDDVTHKFRMQYPQKLEFAAPRKLNDQGQPGRKAGCACGCCTACACHFRHDGKAVRKQCSLRQRVQLARGVARLEPAERRPKRQPSGSEAPRQGLRLQSYVVNKLDEQRECACCCCIALCHSA